MCNDARGVFPQYLIVICGPTASGKTSLALTLAGLYSTHILSADSRQFYRELKIGSAMPADEELARIPHHFIGHLSVNDYYNVSRFETHAVELLTELFRTNDMVIMCGGSGLYINAVCHGIDELPDPDEAIRQQLDTIFAEQGIAALQAKLQRLDPEYYQVVDLQNHTRIIRALEVCMSTGQSYSSLRKGERKKRDFRIVKVALELPKDELMERIHTRTEIMFAAGLEEEARVLYPLRNVNALKTVGYTELFAYFDGQYSLAEAKEKIVTNTWRYAKRQMTWFRKDKEIRWFHPANAEEIMQCVKTLSSLD
jgi:tRNA dimethylallyltransferase